MSFSDPSADEDTSLFPFFSMFPTPTFGASAYQAFFDYFGWTNSVNLGLLYVQDANGVYGTTIVFEAAAAPHRFSVFVPAAGRPM